jgi:protein TonB
MATTDTLAPADPKHYVWWFPGSPVKVHLDLGVVQRLRDGLRGTEAGTSGEGLLFGRVQNGAIEILDFQPASNGNVPNMIAALPSEHGKRFLMGYYRTEKGDTFHLNAKDVALAEECFRKPYHVFLVIHSNGHGSPNATFFFHDGDGRMADFAFLEFPLDPSPLAIEERDRIQRADQAAKDSIEAPSPEPGPSAPDSSSVGSPGNKSRLLLKAARWMCSMALVFSLGALVNNSSFRKRFANLRPAIINSPAVSPSSSSASQSPSLPLIALHAKRQNGDVELTWNRSSALIRNAISGVISIQDGESKSKRQIALDATQVRGGSLLYSPTSDQILMQLTVTTPADTVTESVMVILPKAGSPQTYPLPTAKPPSESVAAPPPTLPSVPLSKSSKPFTEPLMVKDTPSPVPQIPADSPPLKLNLDPATAVPPNLLTQTPAPPPPAHTAHSTQIAAQPAAQPAQPASIVIRYQPAVAIKKIAPTFPPELQSLAVTRKVIEVTVTIDKTGTVTNAEAIPQKNTSLFLINSAVSAARLWKFQPALRDNKPVASESVLQFVFGH